LPKSWPRRGKKPPRPSADAKLLSSDSRGSAEDDGDAAAAEAAEVSAEQASSAEAGAPRPWETEEGQRWEPLWSVYTEADEDEDPLEAGEGNSSGEESDADIEELDEDDEEGGGKGGLQKRPSAALVKILPEERLGEKLTRRLWNQGNKDHWKRTSYGYRPSFSNPVPGPTPDPDELFSIGNKAQAIPEEALAPDGTYPKFSPEGILQAKSKALLDRAVAIQKAYEQETTRVGALPLASVEDKEEFAKASTADAQLKAHERRIKERETPRIADAVGTGSESPDAYVEIGARAGPEEDGPEEEAVNGVVSKALGISVDKASKLVALGSVWVYDEYSEDGWERVKKSRVITPDQVLRVFPNPERFKTCYMEDWRDRLKKVDHDFVAVDKPPMLPCFSKVSNGRETLSNCVKQALHVRMWGDYVNDVTEVFTPCNEIDDEATGLVIVARHEKALEVFHDWLSKGKVSFEFIALCTANLPKGIYRHFYRLASAKAGQPKPVLYEEIPPPPKKQVQDYTKWGVVEMEVVSTAPLPGGCAAIRIRTRSTGMKERIRAQLAMLGAPVLNDQDVYRTGTPVPTQVAKEAGLISEEAGSSPEAGLATLGSVPLAGAVDEETLRSPYGHKLELLPHARAAADQGVPQKTREKVPVALHLARVEYGGRIVTSAPPPYWPQGAAAAVAVQLTTKDIKENIFAFITSRGSRARIGELGGRFGISREWLRDNFPVDVAKGLVFASVDAMKDFEAEQRAKSGDKAYGLGIREKGKAKKDQMSRLRERYVAPNAAKKVPKYKDIKRGRVKVVNS